MTGFTEEQFTGFKRKHYRVNNGLAWDACNAYRERYRAAYKAHFSYAQSVGGVGVFPGSTVSVGNGTPINAVIFEGDLPRGWRSRRWSSFKGLKAGQTPAWPDKRLTAGKEALAAIKALPFKPSPDEVCEAIGFPVVLEYSREDGTSGSECLGFFEVANIGWLDEIFYLSLPDFAGQKARKEQQGYTVKQADWAKPDGMEPILKEEADLDFARARLAKAA